MIVEGPHFLYDAAPRLFLGRSGRGPLEVVWDTNILLDYLQHGRAIWDECRFDVAHEGYYAELEALSLLLNVWTRRDIRITILERSITDAKRRLSVERQLARARAVDEVAAALSLDLWSDHDQENAHAALDIPADALEHVPIGADRELVAEAGHRGAHVFLTRDAGVLRAAPALRRYRLLLASPLDLLEELTACGAMLAVMRPETLYWPVPDLQRISHLIQALGPL